MVEHQFSKLRAGVRFSYPAQQSEPVLNVFTLVNAEMLMCHASILIEVLYLLVELRLRQTCF